MKSRRKQKREKGKDSVNRGQGRKNAVREKKRIRRNDGGWEQERATVREYRENRMEKNRRYREGKERNGRKGGTRLKMRRI